jgi:hypothetical protein
MSLALRQRPVVMVQKSSDQVRSCPRSRSGSGHEAERAAHNELRDDYIQLQRQWLNLARSYQVTEGMLSAFYEHDRDRREFLEDER